MKKLSINWYAIIIFFLVCNITYFIDLSGNKAISITSYLLSLGAVALFIVLRKIDTTYFIGIIIFTLLSQYFGAMLKFYNIIPIYDLILHFSSGILLVFLGHYFLKLLVVNKKIYTIPIIVIVFFCGFFSIAVAGLWEIWEFSGDMLLGLNAQISGIDTMEDIIAGSVGALIGCFLLYPILKRESANEH